MYEVLEATSIARFEDAAGNEDAIVVTDGYLAVIDGETNKGEPASPTPGQLATRAISETLAALSTTTMNPSELVRMLHAAVASMQRPGIQPAASVAIVDVQARRLIRVGDVHVSIDGVVHVSRKTTDRVAAHARALYLAATLHAGGDRTVLRRNDVGRDAILPLLRAAQAFRNSEDPEYGFGSIDGTSTPAALIEIWDLDPSSHEVVLASDGYPTPAPSLALAEHELTELRTRDPLRIGNPPGLKSFPSDTSGYDDRTYLRLRL